LNAEQAPKWVMRKPIREEAATTGGVSDTRTRWFRRGIGENMQSVGRPKQRVKRQWWVTNSKSERIKAGPSGVVGVPLYRRNQVMPVEPEGASAQRWTRDATERMIGARRQMVREGQ
jgi:hypothetical protein